VLPLLGATPLALGRLLRADEDIGDQWVRSVVISHRLWQRRFGGDPSALGRQIQVNNLDVQIVGILGPGFRAFLPTETLATEDIDVWFPGDVGDSRGRRPYPVLGRLARGAELSSAQAELDALAAQLVDEHPAHYPDGHLRMSVHPLRDDLTREASPALFVLAGAVAFVLLIACVNVANLLLARGRARERELAIRRALGAGRGRVARQLFAESLVLAAVAGAVGLWIAVLGVDVVDWLRPSHLPRQSQIALDRTVVMFSVALSAATTLIFGLVPAVKLTSRSGDLSLRAGRAETPAPPMRRLQRALVVGQVALSIVPLVGAGLMLRSFHNLLNAPIGFEASNVLTARIATSFSAFPDFDQRWALFEREILPQVRALPGVDDVSAAAPVAFGSWQTIRRYGRDDDASAPLRRATQQSTLPGYLPIMGIPLRAGRDFTVDDLRAQRPVVIVDERIARQLWPDGAVGRRLLVQEGEGTPEALEVIGVTNAARVTGVRGEDLPHFFVPYHVYAIEMTLVMKTGESAAVLGPALKRIVEPHTRRAVFDIRPMDDYVAESIADARFTLLMLLGFATASVLLAGLGVHGTLAYLTSQRKREFGVRLALGASGTGVVRMVLNESALLVTSGAILGLAGALATTRLLRGLLYEVTPFDAPTLLAVCSVIGVAGLLATWLPARRATRVDPMIILRSE
jgi:predicted permease